MNSAPECYYSSTTFRSPLHVTNLLGCEAVPVHRSSSPTIPNVVELKRRPYTGPRWAQKSGLVPFLELTNQFWETLGAPESLSAPWERTHHSFKRDLYKKPTSLPEGTLPPSKRFKHRPIPGNLHEQQPLSPIKKRLSKYAGLLENERLEDLREREGDTRSPRASWKDPSRKSKLDYKKPRNIRKALAREGRKIDREYTVETKAEFHIGR